MVILGEAFFFFFIFLLLFVFSFTQIWACVRAVEEYHRLLWWTCTYMGRLIKNEWCFFIVEALETYQLLCACYSPNNSGQLVSRFAYQGRGFLVLLSKSLISRYNKFSFIPCESILSQIKA